jgi:flagellar basal-body rod protein FlgG
MFEALYIGATGMQAQQLHVETIANNLANMNTVAFKKGRVSFSDLIARETNRLLQTAGEGAGSGPLAATQRLGAGVSVSAMSKVFDPGELRRTDAPLDIAVRGEGLLEVTMPDGSSAYTRGGSLKVNKDGLLATQAGHPLRPAISIPDNAQSVIVEQDGRVLVKPAGQTTPTEAGQLELVRFTGTGLLTAQGDNLYRPSEASGEAIAVRAGEDGAGTFAQGFLEGSNVKMVDEMVNLMLAQRAYEANVKVVQAADEMLGMVNSLRK